MRNSSGNARVKLGGEGTCVFPWDALMVQQEASTSDIAGWRPMESIDEVREGAMVRIIADEGALKTRMNRIAAGATKRAKYVGGHAGKEGTICKRSSSGNARVEFGEWDAAVFPWDALMVQKEAEDQEEPAGGTATALPGASAAPAQTPFATTASPSSTSVFGTGGPSVISLPKALSFAKPANQKLQSSQGELIKVLADEERFEEEEECCICYGATISRKDAAELPTDSCRHAKRSVCDNCLARHVQAEVSEKGLANRKVSCPQRECKAVMAHHNVQRWAIASVFETYDTLLLRAHLQNLEDFRWCATPGCGSGQIHAAMDQAPIMRCIKCKQKTCFTHRCLWHEGRTCTQYDKDAEECEEVALLQALEEGGNLRKCPKCGQGIEKTTGCDHMTCRKPMGCGHEFCWRCLAPYDGDQGIRKVGNSAHKESCRYYM